MRQTGPDHRKTTFGPAFNAQLGTPRPLMFCRWSANRLRLPVLSVAPALSFGCRCLSLVCDNGSAVPASVVQRSMERDRHSRRLAPCAADCRWRFDRRYCRQVGRCHREARKFATCVPQKLGPNHQRRCPGPRDDRMFRPVRTRREFLEPMQQLRELRGATVRFGEHCSSTPAHRTSSSRTSW